MASPHRIVVLAIDGVYPFELGIPSRVFGAADGRYDVLTCSVDGRPVRTNSDFSIAVEHGLEALSTADTVVIPSFMSTPFNRQVPLELTDALAAAAPRTRLVSICTGAFVLAAAGLLDGRPATTHWALTDLFRTWYPQVTLDPDVLFIDDGDVLTSAGAASGIDLCLHILRGDLGVAASNHAARRLVAAPYRSGGQAQYVPRSVPEPLGERFAATREWALHRLGEPLTLEILAGHAAVSPRTFSRRFVEDTGYTPMQWVLRARVDMVRELLERSDLGVEQIAARAGLGTGANLRLHFKRILGTSPSDYRQTFARGE